MPYPFECISDFLFVEHEVMLSDVILVPGGSAPEQMQKAVDLYNAGFALYILPSGGLSTRLKKWPSEWAYYHNLAVKAGVPEIAILKEDKATNTLENAMYSWQVLQQMDFSITKAILVCKAHHSRRALLTYQAIFPPEVAFAVSPIIDNRNIRKDNWYLDEQKIHFVFEELRKIGTYLETYVPNWLDRGE
jgi:uncharacterized SAM-binding protein YcdF (DUF218 family)